MTEIYGGAHSLTATLKNALAHAGVRHPQSGEPLSEALVLGIGGGLGACYILWEFEAYDSAMIVLGFRNRCNYAVDYLSNACDRLNVKVDFRETAGSKKAQTNLDTALAERGTAILWVDKGSLPYHGLPEAMKGHIAHLVRVMDGDGDDYIVDDISERPWALSAVDLRAARQPIPSNKQRCLSLSPSPTFDLASAVLTGIHDHIEHLSRSSESFSLPVYQKWAKLMTHPKNKKGWRKVFSRRAGLYTTLRTIFEGITLDDTEGAGLREMYANFLTEADALLDQDLSKAIAAYRACAAAWRDFAESVLSDDLPVFAETKALMRARYAAFANQDCAALTQTMTALHNLEAANNLDRFPLDDAATDALFLRMQEQLLGIYQAEQFALQQLKAAIE